MQARSVAIGAGKIPLKVIRPQLPGMTKTTSASVAGASTLLGEARPQLDTSVIVSASQGKSAAQHTMPGDSLLPSSSAGTTAAKPAAMASDPSGIALGQNGMALEKTHAAQDGKPASVMNAMIHGEAPPAATPQRQGSGHQSVAGEKTRPEGAHGSKGRVEEHNRDR